MIRFLAKHRAASLKQPNWAWICWSEKLSVCLSVCSGNGIAILAREWAFDFIESGPSTSPREWALDFFQRVGLLLHRENGPSISSREWAFGISVRKWRWTGVTYRLKESVRRARMQRNLLHYTDNMRRKQSQPPLHPFCFFTVYSLI